MANVEAAQMKTTSADRLLEQALACDFSIRSAARFRLVKAIIRAQQGRLDEAIVEIEYLMATQPEISFSLQSTNIKSDNDSRAAGGSSSSSYSTNTGLSNKAAVVEASSTSGNTAQLSNSNNNTYADCLRLVDDDRVGAFVCYSSLLGKARRMKEANSVLAHAKVTFAGSPQEVQVLVAASQLYVEKNDFDAAIRMLDKVPQDNATYPRAQLIKADIILNHNHDKEGFTRCYQQLADRDPTARNYALLGEAYLRILNPEAAIDALKQAYKLDPKNGRLRGRIGD
jgi:tetratricopeptide (TPR) repeat protein